LAACYKENGDLLVGTSDGLYVLCRGESKLTECSTDMKLIASVVEHHQNVFILHRAQGVCKVEMCLGVDITKRKELFRFERSSDAVGVMTVSDRFVAV